MKALALLRNLGWLAAGVVLMSQAAPLTVSGQVATPTPTPYQQVIVNASTGVQAVATLSAGELTDLQTRINATPTPSGSTLAPGAAAGTGATVAFVAGAQSDTRRGAIQWITGTLPTAGAQVVVTFPSALSRPPYIDCRGINAASAALQPYATSITASGATIAVVNTPLASTTYQCEYLVAP